MARQDGNFGGGLISGESSPTGHNQRDVVHLISDSSQDAGDENKNQEDGGK